MFAPRASAGAGLVAGVRVGRDGALQHWIESSVRMAPCRRHDGVRWQLHLLQFNWNYGRGAWSYLCKPTNNERVNMETVRVIVTNPLGTKLGELDMQTKQGELYPANIYVVLPDGTRIRYTINPNK